MDDEDICRVCHSESTPEQPLFHPCKCSGSIKHVHQECLIEWLNHSQMTNCELCNHPFTFTPVYRSDMPEVIPPALMFQQFNKKIKSGLLFALRATFVGFIWLIILPYITVWIWRLYFFIGDHVSTRLFKLKEVKHQLGLNTSTLNLTSIFFTALSDNDTVTANWIQEYKSRFSMHAFFSDCFEGQVITSIVVVFFISVFLLKEWIIQNIPMEVLPLEDEPQVFEPAFQEEPVQPDPPSPRFEDLFDGDWGEEYNEQPDNYGYLNRGPFNQPTNLNQFDLPVPDERVRAASMPPDFGGYRTSSVRDEFDNSRRAISMEPAIDTTMLRSHFFPQTPEYHGPPPSAPRMRHAEANVPIRPIIEEIELPVPIEPLAVEPIVEEENVEEFEGILEAIGMDGNLASLLQNSTLMGLLIALILGVTVWMPYLIGVLFIMTDKFDLIRIPLELVRMITDPLIDFLFLVWPDYIWPFICNLYHSCIHPLLKCTVLFDKAAAAFSLMFTYPSLSDTIATNPNVTESVMDQSIQYVTKFINGTAPLMEHAFNRYQQFATGQAVIDRMACIAIGYMVVISFSTWYLSGNMRDNLATALFGLTAQEAFRHQCIVLKVGFFLCLELVLFPIVCGFVINVSTLPLFKEATLLSRGQFLITHPIIFVFLHWTIGTLFMFLFTLLVTLCRDILRSGVMWFIRDPGDPQFHPVREIAERPALTQLKKIGASAFIYIMIILVGIAGVVQCLKSVGAGILPLRWNLSNLTVISGPISIVPVDIIMLQVVVPAFIKHFKPTALLLSLSIKWLRYVSRKLRLTSFLFGKRKSREEGTLVYHTWWAWIRRIEPERVPRVGTQDSLIGNDVSYIWTGQLLRVPGHDNVPIVGNRRMLVPVYTDTLEPIDETERILGHPAATAPGGNETNTVIVYSPPHLIRRLVLFAVIMWLSSTAAFCYMTLLPVVIGRHLFKTVVTIETEVHDLYSFILGISISFYFIYSIILVYKTICDIWIRPTWKLRARRARRHLRRWTRRTLHWGWFITWFAIALPLVFGVLFKLYVSFSLASVGKEPITIKLLPVWSQGLSCMLVFYRFIQYAPPGPAKEMLDSIFRQGIGKMNIKASFTKLIAPLLIASVCVGCLPFATAYLNIFLTDPTNPGLRTKIIQLTYRITFIGIAVYQSGKLGLKIKRRLAETVREDTYLVGQTLHNHEN